MLNLQGWILLSALLLVAFLELGVAVLTLVRKQGVLPKFFEDTISPEDYLRSQAYVRAQTKLEIVSQVMHLAALLAFWFLGGFPWLDQQVTGLGHGALVTGLIYLAVLSLVSFLMDIPFSIFRTFVLEERFGLNRTTVATFVADLLKGTLLTVVLGGLLLSAILAFLLWAGGMAWIACWLVSIVLIIAIQFAAPRWIIPLFMRFSPLPEGALRTAILEYAARVAFPVAEVSVVDGSRRSAKANAFFSGFGSNRRIALFDTLVERLSVDEMVAVVAHEVGHDRHRHLFKGMAATVVHLGLVFWLFSLFLTEPGFFQAFFVEQTSVHVGLALFGIFFGPLDLILSLFWKALSRRNERQADGFALSSTGDPMAMATALKKLAAANLSQLDPHPLHVWLHASHPPVTERVAALLVKEAEN